MAKKAKKISFKDLRTVDYKPGATEQEKHNAHKRKKDLDRGLNDDVQEGYRIHAVSHDDETFKSGIHPTKKAALDVHYKMSKSKNWKTIKMVKEVVNSADKKPEKYVDQDGKVRVRMIPVDKEIVKKEVGKTDKKKLGEDSEVDEALDIRQRRQRSLSAKKNKAKLAMGRKRASRRMADVDKLRRRARKQARAQLVAKLLKDVPKGDLSAARKQEIEKRVDKLGPRIDRIAKKLLPTIRQKEVKRKKG